MNTESRVKLLVSALGFIIPSVANADTYKTADFTIGVLGGDTNQQSPFQGVVAPYPASGTFSGSLVFDQDLVPGSGTGFVNVMFSSFPNIAQIPAATALNFKLGALSACFMFRTSIIWETLTN